MRRALRFCSPLADMPRKLRLPGRRSRTNFGLKRNNIGAKVLRSSLGSNAEFEQLSADEIENMYEFEIVDEKHSGHQNDEPTLLGEAAKTLSECFRGLLALPGRRRKKQREKQLHMTQILHEKITTKVGECEKKIDKLNIAVAKCVKSGDRVMAKQREYINQMPNDIQFPKKARKTQIPCAYTPHSSSALSRFS